MVITMGPKRTRNAAIKQGRLVRMQACACDGWNRATGGAGSTRPFSRISWIMLCKAGRRGKQNRDICYNNHCDHGYPEVPNYWLAAPVGKPNPISAARFRDSAVSVAESRS